MWYTAIFRLALSWVPWQVSQSYHQNTHSMGKLQVNVVPIITSVNGATMQWNRAAVQRASATPPCLGTLVHMMNITRSSPMIVLPATTLGEKTWVWGYVHTRKVHNEQSQSITDSPEVWLVRTVTDHDPGSSSK